VVIRETCIEISDLKQRAHAQYRTRYARRNMIRLIDQLINEFEMLNLAEEVAVPGHLRHRAVRVIADTAHPLAQRTPEEIPIADWMEALYDLQDTLMLPGEDDID
jgi:hypothetical protein